jgi:hypothetical protein
MALATFVLSLPLLLPAPLRAQSAPSDCVGTVRLEGEPSAAFREALVARGLRVVSATECAGVTVEVHETGGRWQLALQGEGGGAVRELERIETAALLVESWSAAADVDLLEPSVASVPAPAPSVTPDTSSAPTTDATAPRAVPDAAPAPATEPVAAVLAEGEVTLGGDGSTWFGARVGACASAGPFCLGGSLRYLADTGLSEGSLGAGEARSYLGPDLDVALPIAVSSALRVVPAIDVGVGWMHITTVDAGRTVTADEPRARLGASLSGAVRMIDWLFLELGFSFTWSPLAHSVPWITDAITIDPDPPVYGSVRLGLRAELR